MNAPTKIVEVTPQVITFHLDGKPVEAFEGESILKAAERSGVCIPHLCYKDGLRADGNCRACVVEIKGERTLAPSCCRAVTAGMEVQATSARALKSQTMVLEMLLSDMPDVGYKWNDGDFGNRSAAGIAVASGAGDTPGASWCEHKSAPGASPAPAGALDGATPSNYPSAAAVPGGGSETDLCLHYEGSNPPPGAAPAEASEVHPSATLAKKSAVPPGATLAGASAEVPPGQHGELSTWAARLGVTVRPALRALRREQPPSDLSHPAMAVNLDACIQCKRCVRACREEQVNDVIGYALRGAHSAIVFDLSDPMGDSTCVACGECVQACPTGALMPKTHIGSQVVDKKVDSVCPFCGVGCLLTYNVKDNKIVSVDGRDGPANHSRLCVKGRFGFDYVASPQRLTVPLIRKQGVVKDRTAQPPERRFGPLV